MRRGVGILALALVLGAVAPLGAQKAKSFGLGGPPAQIVNVPLDTSKTTVPVLPAQPRQPFSLARFLPKLFRPGAPSQIGISPLPPPGAFPSTQYGNAISPLPTAQRRK